MPNTSDLCSVTAQACSPNVLLGAAFRHFRLHKNTSVQCVSDAFRHVVCNCTDMFSKSFLSAHVGNDVQQGIPVLFPCLTRLTCVPWLHRRVLRMFCWVLLSDTFVYIRILVFSVCLMRSVTCSVTAQTCSPRVFFLRAHFGTDVKQGIPVFFPYLMRLTCVLWLHTQTCSPNVLPGAASRHFHSHENTAGLVQYVSDMYSVNTQTCVTVLLCVLYRRLLFREKIVMCFLCLLICIVRWLFCLRHYLSKYDIIKDRGVRHPWLYIIFEGFHPLVII